MHLARHVIRTVTETAPAALLRSETNLLPFAGTVEESRRTTTIGSHEALDTALRTGLHDEWKALVANDPLASLFQTTGWCLPWYHAYADAFDPFVITVRENGQLIGLVPMTVERATRRLLFASDTMADYRDIVALPGHRAAVVDALIGAWLDGRFSNTLQVGFIDPASDTPRLMADACARRGLKHLVGHQPCYRWFPPAGKPSAQKFLNWFKRQGDVSFDVVTSEDAWTRFRDAYYRQHSLRQVQAGRERAFDDPRRAALYEQLFHSTEIQPHATAFTLNGELLAGHFGFVWRDVLLLGPPSIHLEHEQRSPAVILLSWIIQNASQLGLSGFDLTIGDSEFKKRLGNQCVQLTTVEVFRSRWTYWTRLARKRVMDAVKSVVARVAGPDAWKTKVKPVGEALAHKALRAREEGILSTIKTLASTLVTAIAERRVGNVYVLEPSTLRAVEPRLTSPAAFEVHDNRVEDLLLWHGASLTTRSAITHAARSYARARNTNRTLHTVTIDGRLAGWGYSFYPTEPVQLTETPGATLAFPPQTVSLYDFHVVPEFRGRRIYEAFLAHVARSRFAEGAPRAYASALTSNLASRAGLERVGFRIVARNVHRRLLKSASVRTEHVDTTSDSYESYLKDEWLLFASDKTRQEEARHAASGVEVRSVLDVGCGGGQDLIPFAAPGTRCVGIDVSHASGVWAARQFAESRADASVRFTTGAAEHLPFADATFDLVLCRVAIPYTDNRVALAEIGRVLRPGGLLLLKTHSARYYLRKLLDGVRRRSPLFCIHAIRVLVTGSLYAVTGRQPRGGVLLRETFQSRGRVEQALREGGLSIDGELRDSNPWTPSFRVVKHGIAARP